MKRQTLGVTALLLVACGPLAAQTPAPVASSASAPTSAAVPSGYRLVWSDEFDTPGQPNAAHWVADTVRNKDGWYNNEKQYYAAGRLENAEVRDGRLVITARRESLHTAPDWGGQAYTSARLITRGKADWTYGFFEIRARMPCGKGTWPAIWTLGRGGHWPGDGELDILEHMGHTPLRISSAVHTSAGSGGHAVGGTTRLPDACRALHDYQMHWTPQAISFGVDGVVHWVYTRRAGDVGAWPFDKPQFLILNLAIGGDLGGAVDDAIFPVAMEIDHVRVYQARP
ncbi:MAG TPA: glycoside hydrolase family 16 protein [Rubrivivax sp.]|nr:glycoside hydrolase family 16 protein [Rubrivivax sp.]